MEDAVEDLEWEERLASLSGSEEESTTSGSSSPESPTPDTHTEVSADDADSMRDVDVQVKETLLDYTLRVGDTREDEDVSRFLSLAASFLAWMDANRVIFPNVVQKVS